MGRINIMKKVQPIADVLVQIFWDTEEPELPKQNSEVDEVWKKVWSRIDRKEEQLTKGIEKKKEKSTMARQIQQKVSSNVKDTRKGEQPIGVQSKEHEEENIIE